MFDVGFPELVLVFIIGLLVLGPERLPKVAAEIGKWVGRARRTATELRRQLEREIELSDIQPPPPPPPKPPEAEPPPPGANAGSSSEADAAPTETPGGAEGPEPAPPVADPNAPSPEAAERPPQS